MPRPRASLCPSKVKFTSCTPCRSAASPNVASAPWAAPEKRIESEGVTGEGIAARKAGGKYRSRGDEDVLRPHDPSPRAARDRRAPADRVEEPVDAPAVPGAQRRDHLE